MANRIYHFCVFAFAFFIFGFLFLGFSSPVFAQDENLFCFSKEECEGKPYEGIPSQTPAFECQGQEGGRQFYCYALPPRVCPPGTDDATCAVKLQVQIAGTNIEGLPGYIAAVYRYLIAVSGILAGIMITYAGVRWLLSAGSPEKIADAKKKISEAIIGLLLVVSSYVILQTINPALVTLSLPPVKMMRQLGIKFDEKCITTGVSSGDLSQMPCGKNVDCSKIPAACGGNNTGTCIGQRCDGGECTEVSMAGNLAGGRKMITWKSRDSELRGKEYKENFWCVDRSKCVSCSSIKINVAVKSLKDDGGIATCLACGCLIVEKGDTAVCAQAKMGGESCGSDAECNSGICNTGYFPDKCAPPGGEGENQPCGDDKHCKKNLVCNTVSDPYNFCLPPQPAGESCRRDEECQSGDCDKTLGLFVGCCRTVRGGKCPQF